MPVNEDRAFTGGKDGETLRLERSQMRKTPGAVALLIHRGIDLLRRALEEAAG